MSYFDKCSSRDNLIRIFSTVEAIKDNGFSDKDEQDEKTQDEELNKGLTTIIKSNSETKNYFMRKGPSKSKISTRSKQMENMNNNMKSAIDLIGTTINNDQSLVLYIVFIFFFWFAFFFFFFLVCFFFFFFLVQKVNPVWMVY